MKKFIYVLALGAMFSCSTEDESQMNDKTGLVKSGEEYGLANPGNDRIFDDTRDYDDWCYGSGGLCLDDVVITIDRSDDCDEVINAVLDGNQSTIKGMFVKHRDFLLEFMEIGVVDGVITDNLYVQFAKSTTKTYVTFYHKSTDELAAVYPILK